MLKFLGRGNGKKSSPRCSVSHVRVSVDRQQYCVLRSLSRLGSLSTSTLTTLRWGGACCAHENFFELFYSVIRVRFFFSRGLVCFDFTGARGILGRPDPFHHPQRQRPRARGRHLVPPRVGARGAPSEIDAHPSYESVSDTSPQCFDTAETFPGLFRGMFFVCLRAAGWWA